MTTLSYSPIVRFSDVTGWVKPRLAMLLVLIGAGLALVPVAYPVWEQEWIARNEMFVHRNGNEIHAATANFQKNYEQPPKEARRFGQWRGFLFTVQQPPQSVTWPVSSYEGLSVSERASIESFRASPLYGRMIFEAAALFAPFALAALVVRRSHSK